MKLLAVELVYDNQIQVLSDVSTDEIPGKHRCTINSESVGLSNQSELVQKITTEFPFTEFENPKGFCSHVDYIQFATANPSKLVYRTFNYIHGESREVLKQERAETMVADCLEDITQHPEKVQKFASIVFTDEVKAAFIASLPRVDEPIIKERQVTVELPVMIANPDYDPKDEDSPKQIQKTEDGIENVEATTVMDGAVLRKVAAYDKPIKIPVVDIVGVTNEDGAKVMEEYDTGETQTFIEYKGELYPEDWKG